MYFGDKMLRCIYCGNEAEYIAVGISVCKKHLDNISSWDIPGGKEAVKQFKEYRDNLDIG